MTKKRRDGNGSGDSAAGRRTVRFSGVLETADAASYLEGIAAALRDKQLLVRSDDASLETPLPGRVEVGLRAKTSRNGRKSSLSLRLGWREAPDASGMMIASGVTGDEAATEETDGSEPAATS